MREVVDEFTTGLFWLCLVVGWWACGIGGIALVATAQVVGVAALVVGIFVPLFLFGAVVGTWGIGVDMKKNASPDNRS